ncbi:hypothetical protein GUITHDRAFT_120417 [Guillardia theta CCMP2712]|uniref:N-acetyltransferase domain-containing protein n=1 Tax=Guillardia theta (strain CCMP2712) TaxID=905079 RepID=L1IB16_GUITC|nr:hypothetical protein GUITHDRAFT_120417 [Guillardia theta CCMP2712]EKX33413.1 hypothetical protein GUITHDRAFT_120417 [Guillardia theta CCMP2712]|eukprot:XP_005820393.1 hypothetical protein GUITHDRAFT_120417 [Guillardia theta CCMP2712]
MGGYGKIDEFKMYFLEQGWRSYLVAEDTNTGEVVGCAQLTRIQLGGYFYIKDDLQIKNLFVKPEYHRMGIANHLIHGLLQRLKPRERAWSLASKDSEAFFLLFASGFVGLTWSEVGRVFPGLLWWLMWPFHLQRLADPSTIYFAAEGRGDDKAYNPAG